MRKSFGLLVTAALLLSTVVVVASGSAGAAGGTTCSKTVATATITPGLPPLSKPTTFVTKVVTKATGTVSGCTGTVKSGALSLTSVPGKSKSNCKTLLTYDPKAVPTSGTGKIVWNTKATSSFSFKLLTIKGAPTSQTFSSTITAGLFAGSKGTVTFSFTAVPKTGCVSTPLSKVTTLNKGPLVIK